MFARLRPFILLSLLGLVFFAPLLLHPTGTLYSKRSDMIAEHIPAKRFLIRSWRETGELPLWCPYQFAGEPFVHDIQVGVFYPPYWILFLFPPEAAGCVLSWVIVGHVIAAGCCMVGYARSHGLGCAGATAAGISYMFAGKWMFHLLDAGHTILIGLAWLPLVLLLLESAVRRGGLVRATAAGTAAGLMILGTQPQWTFYSALLAAGLTLGTALESAGWLGGAGPRSARRTLAALGRWLGLGLWAALTAGALSAVQLLPTLEAASQATRGAGVAPDDVVREFLYTVHELVGPGPVVCLRWENRAGFGVLALTAALLAPVLCRGRVRWQAALWLTLWALALGGGTLLADAGCPGFRTFRLHVRAFITAGLLTALLVGAATDALFARAVVLSPRRKKLAIALVLVALAVGVAALASEAILGIPDGEEVRFPFYPLALAILVPAGAALLILRLRSGGGGPAGRAAGLAWLGLLLVELWAMSWPMVQICDENDLYKPSSCVSFIIDAERDGSGRRGRVLDTCIKGTLGHAALGSGCPLGPIYGLEVVSGYNPLDVHRFRDYLQLMADDPAPVRAFDVPFGHPILLSIPVRNKSLADLLGVRYLLQPRDPGDQPDGHDPARPPGWRRILEDEDARSYSFTLGGVLPLPPYTVWENQSVLPRAFVAPRAAPLPNRPELLDALKRTDFKETVLLEGWRDEFAAAPGDAGRTVQVADYRPNRVTLHTEGAAGWLVLTDVWFPGWKCTVNGRAVEIHRADFLFRAVAVPDEPCEVVFTFEPESYLRGRELSLGAAALVAVLFGGAGLRRFMASRSGPIRPSRARSAAE